MILALALLLLVATPGGSAVVMAQTSPRAAAHDFLSAIESRRWREAAALVDPEQLAPYREETLAILVAWAQQRDEIRRRPLRRSGALTALSTEGKLDPQALARVGDTPLPAIRGVRTLRDLAALPPADFLAHVLELADIRSADSPGDLVESSTHRILGAVNESDSVAHVLYRAEDPRVRYDDPYHVEVLATVRRGDRWYVHGSHRGAGFTRLAFLLARLDWLDTERAK